MSFDVNRLRRSDWTIGGGAVALFVFLFFFDWYGGSYKGPASIGGFGASVSATGWQTFTNSRWIWLLTIVVAIGAVLLVAGQRKLEMPVSPGALVAGLGALSALLILYRILHHPSGGASFAGGSFSYGIKIGIWLGLIAAVAIAYGGYLKIGEEGSSPAPAFTASSAPSSPPPASPLSASPPDATPAEQSAPAESQPAPLPPPSPGSAGESGI